MKKIAIKNIENADRTSVLTKQRKHRVFLGNGVTVYFSDLKKAKSFLTRTNEFLTQKLFDLNSLYIDLFIEYRKAWFMFFNTYDRQMHVVSDNSVLREIEIIEKKMTLMISRAHFTNGSSIVIHSFEIILESMRAIVRTLYDLYRKKKYYAQTHQIKTIGSRIDILQDQLSNWGKDQESFTFLER